MKKEKPTFENKMYELELILQQMGSEETALEQSLELYAKAAVLIQEISKTLNDAEIKIKEIDLKVKAF